MAIDSTTTPYSGDPDSYPEVSYLPTDATEGKAQTFNTPYQALFDRTAWLRDRLLLDPPLVPLFSGQQAPTALTSAPLFTPHRIDPAGADTKRGGWLQTLIQADGGGIWWHIPISPAVVVTMVAASINGDDGPGTNPGLPSAAQRPFMKLYRQPIDGSDASLLLTLADESAAAYESHHTIPQNPGILFDPPLSFAADEYLSIHFAGHYGANVAANTLKLYGIQITTALPAP